MDEFTKERRDKYVAVLTETGEPAAARVEVGVSHATVKLYRKRDAEFGEACEEALRIYRSKLAREVHRRGVEGVDEPIYCEGVCVGYVRKYSDRLLIEHIRRHDPRYREQVKVKSEHSGKVEVAMDLSQLSVESQLALKAILEKEGAADGPQEGSPG